MRPEWADFKPEMADRKPEIGQAPKGTKSCRTQGA